MKTLTDATSIQTCNMSWGVSDDISSYHIYMYAIASCFSVMLWGKFYVVFTVPCSRAVNTGSAYRTLASM